MDNDNNKPDPNNTPNEDQKNGGENGGKSGDNNDTPKTFTQKELDRVLAERLAREKEAQQKAIDEAVTKAQKEAERRAKLSADEREAEMRADKENALKKQALDLQLRENRMDGLEKLSELKIPAKFVDFVLNEDSEKMMANIEKFNTEWTSAISEEVKRQLKGDTPRDPKGGNVPAESSVVTSF